MADYPIVKIPKRFLQINQAIPALPPAPVAPTEPVEPEVPTKPNSRESSGLAGCLGLPVLLFAIAIFVSGNEDAHRVVGTALTIASVLIWIKGRNSESKSVENINSEMQAKYLKSMQKYNEEKKAYDLSKNKYNTDCKKYAIDKSNYDLMIIKLCESDEYNEETKKLRYSLLKKALNEAAVPAAYLEKQYTAGVTEGWFFNRLVDFFNKITIVILRQHTILNDELKRPYMPDFILSIAELNQNVVIEIDEPYVGKDGTPIHYVDSSDTYRDKYFLANGWAIVRFAEEQIIKQPAECMSFVLDLLSTHTPSPEISLIVATKRVQAIFAKAKSANNGEAIQYSKENLDKLPQWSKEQAHKMAFSRYRSTYLPAPLVAKIVEEECVPSNSSDSEPRTAFNREEGERHDEEMRKLYGDGDGNDLPF